MGSRRRFLVALVPPEPLVDGLRALRTAVGGVPRERIPLHVTVVPPVNVAVGAVPEVRTLVRQVATRARPFEVELGPAASFAPANRTLHLELGGGPESLAELSELRAALRVGALDRPDRHAFVPHLTLRRDADEAAVAAAGSVLPGRLGPWTVDRLVLAEQVHRDGATWWDPVAEEPFGGPVVVGRGGIEVHLRTVSVLEALVHAGDEPLVADDAGTDGTRRDASGPVDDAGTGPVRWAPAGRWPEPDSGQLVVVAERPDAPGAVIGRAVGSVHGGLAELSELRVVPEERGQGIARQLVGRWCTDAASKGAHLALAEVSEQAALVAMGFAPFGDLLLRRLPGRRTG